MAKQRKKWVFAPPKLPKPTVPEDVKQEVEAQANALVESVLKVRHISPPPDNTEFNYIVDIDTKWHRGYFYFVAVYCSPGPHAIAPTFDTKFARMEYAGDRSFHLSYMRHTGKWFEIYRDLSLDECLKAISEHPAFFP